MNKTEDLIIEAIFVATLAIQEFEAQGKYGNKRIITKVNAALTTLKEQFGEEIKKMGIDRDVNTMVDQLDKIQKNMK